MALSPRVVLCMKWGALYPASYVNVLYSAVRRNLEGDFRFVCLTPEPEGLDGGIETYPIPDLGYSLRHWRHGAWPKLSVFVPDLYGLKGRALFIDLDSMVLQSLEPFFVPSKELTAIGGGPNWRRGKENPNPTLASGVFSFELGSEPQIAERFSMNPEGAFDTFEIEQRFVERHVSAWKPWPASWVVSFKRHLRQPLFIDRFRPPRLPQESTRILAFHGRPRPIDVVRPGHYNWDRFPHFGRGPIPWVRDYWLENGYRDPE